MCDVWGFFKKESHGFVHFLTQLCNYTVAWKNSTLCTILIKCWGLKSQQVPFSSQQQRCLITFHTNVENKVWAAAVCYILHVSYTVPHYLKLKIFLHVTLYNCKQASFVIQRTWGLHHLKQGWPTNYAEKSEGQHIPPSLPSGCLSLPAMVHLKSHGAPAESVAPLFKNNKECPDQLQH